MDSSSFNLEDLSPKLGLMMEHMKKVEEKHSMNAKIRSWSKKQEKEEEKKDGVTIIRAQIVESQEVTIAKFLCGLNRDIQDIIELHDYTSLSALVHQVFKFESQLMRHEKKSYPTTCSN
ncbi:hypothetical protein CR513_05371, partial [Mucuna pruriens]